jgi:hypothetical protein
MCGSVTAVTDRGKSTGALTVIMEPDNDSKYYYSMQTKTNKVKENNQLTFRKILVLSSVIVWLHASVCIYREVFISFDIHHM